MLLALGTFAVSHQITAQLVICQEEKERARGHPICWRDTSLLRFVLQQQPLVYTSLSDEDIWLSKLYGLERCSSRLEGETAA